LAWNPATNTSPLPLQVESVVNSAGFPPAAATAGFHALLP
jgi:hypothetical protein